MKNLKKCETMDEAIQEVLNHLVDVSKSEKWMVVFWKVQDGRLYLDSRVTWDFPTGDFDASVKLLKNHLDELKGREQTAEPPPLEMAKIVQQRYEELARSREEVRISPETLKSNKGDDDGREDSGVDSPSEKICGCEDSEPFTPRLMGDEAEGQEGTGEAEDPKSPVEGITGEVRRGDGTDQCEVPKQD